MKIQISIYFACPTDNFPTFADQFEDKEILIDNKKFLKLLNKTKISISNDDTRHYLNGIFLHLTEAHGRNFLTELPLTATDCLLAVLKLRIQTIFRL